MHMNIELVSGDLSLPLCGDLYNEHEQDTVADQRQETPTFINRKFRRKLGHESRLLIEV